MSEPRSEQGRQLPTAEPEGAVFQASAIEVRPEVIEPSTPERQPPPVKRPARSTSAKTSGPKIADRRELPNLVLATFGFVIWALLLTQCVRLSQDRVAAISPDLARVSYERALLGLDLTAEQLLGEPSSPLIPHLTRGLQGLIVQLPWPPLEKLPELLWILLGLMGVMKGAQRLYERRDLSWLAGGLYTLFAAPLLITPHLATWHLPLITWVSASIVALWGAPHSKRWSLLAGLLVAQGVAASPVYLVFTPYLFLTLLSSRKVKGPEGERRLRFFERLTSLTLSLVGLALGVAPWVLKGNFVLPPLNYMRAEELLISAASAIQLGAEQQLSAPWGWTAGLTLLAAFTWMSAHISGVPWTKRGIGLGVVTVIHLALSAQLMGEGAEVIGDCDAQLVMIAPLIWIAVHPWSPIGSFVLLPFKPLLKRLTSFALFGLIAFTPMKRAYEHVFVEELMAAQRDELMKVERGNISAELLAIKDWFNQPSIPQEKRQLWVWGEEAWPLYSLLGGLSPKAAPLLGHMSFDDPRLRGMADDLKAAPLHLIVISSRYAKLKTPKLMKELRDSYHRVPPADYAWPEVSAFEVYVTKRARMNPRRLNQRAATRTQVASPPPAPPPKNQPPALQLPTLTPPPPKAPKPPPLSPAPPTADGLPDESPSALPLPKSGPALKSPVIPVTDTLPPIPPRFAPEQDAEEGTEESTEESTKVKGEGGDADGADLDVLEGGDKPQEEADQPHKEGGSEETEGAVEGGAEQAGEGDEEGDRDEE